MRYLVAALLVGISLCRAGEPAVLTGRAMGTTWTIKFLPPPPTPSPPQISSPDLSPTILQPRIAAHLEHLEAIFSTYRPTSELSRFNASASTDWLPVSAELARVAHASRRISELTSGAFDATVAPLVLLWGFGSIRRTDAPPSDSAIAAARLQVDYHQLEILLSPPALRKKSARVTADFSSLAKGYAADSLSALLTTLGAPDHFVQIGGDIKTAGPHVWRTAIENPRPTVTPAPTASPSSTAPATPPLSPLAATLSLADQSLSTSGDTRNFTILQGRRYGHIIDPLTGRPVSGPLASVSVVHTSCAESSALATALFVLGPEAGFALAVRENFACLFLVRDGPTIKPRPTPAFVRLTRPPPLSPP